MFLLAPNSRKVKPPRGILSLVLPVSEATNLKPPRGQAAGVLSVALHVIPIVESRSKPLHPAPGKSFGNLVIYGTFLEVARELG
jgi:hypothetical protein